MCMLRKGLPVPIGPMGGGGVASRQRITYDQLTLTQFVQGFSKRTPLKNLIKKFVKKCSCVSLVSWRMLLILHGPVQKPPMRCYYVRWRGALLIGLKPIE